MKGTHFNPGNKICMKTFYKPQSTGNMQGIANN